LAAEKLRVEEEAKNPVDDESEEQSGETSKSKSKDLTEYFKIYSFLKGHRVMARAKLNSDSYGQRVFLKNNENGARKGSGQWWFLDSRTRSIRAADDRNKALSNLEGKRDKQTYTLVARPWKAQDNQKVEFAKGK